METRKWNPKTDYRNPKPYNPEPLTPRQKEVLSHPGMTAVQRKEAYRKFFDEIAADPDVSPDKRMKAMEMGLRLSGVTEFKRKQRKKEVQPRRRKEVAAPDPAPAPVRELSPALRSVLRKAGEIDEKAS